MRPSSLAIGLPSLLFWRSKGQHRDMTALYVRTIAGVVALCLWTGSLAAPAATLCVGDTVFSGWNVLLAGWMGARLGIFGWFTNPFLLLEAGCLLLELPAFTDVSAWRAKGSVKPSSNLTSGLRARFEHLVPESLDTGDEGS